ncbi:MAG: GNAT family N-acetyltransferase [Pseudomonadales bacterium]|jgi:GNAT superfamily N-acetyltransferase|nr:GNAT family N-acetyltransferase [Pseudomonadales bacterium]MDP4639433.1 GNAT family N-acetyltransferase [Pseudomonadales bacterium]MDP4764728.1 GNAT family N-acetyltransferase [Pseudomonadales bacterium]MDP4876389.1 GNAT family N-acetyltransferase [Pseudomonadales bacterium]MDP4911930.1 GNAT family N-acetyltransferase [Pseudomonadales bacterium]
MSITVRPASTADIAGIAAFNQAMAIETEGKALATNKIMAGVTRMLNDPSLGFYLVAEADGGLVGCLGITFEWSDWRNGLFWWIQSVFVDPDYRRRGVFANLYNYVGELARQEQDVCGIRLYVEHDNSNAQRTYLGLGMVETAYKLLEVEF